MQDRLRRLDHMFAEKVLGCKFRYDWTTANMVLGKVVGEASRLKPIDECEPGCGCYGAPHVDPHGESCEIAPYTRSLDAAWAGAQRLGWECNFSRLEGGDGWKCFLDTADIITPDIVAGGYFRSGDTQTHPAEALVLACLRACGVAEEDLP